MKDLFSTEWSKIAFANYHTFLLASCFQTAIPSTAE